MATAKVTELTTLAGSGVANNDLLLIVDRGTPDVSKAITADELAQAPQLTGRYGRLANANTFTVGGHVIDNDAAGTIPLTIQGHASQSADLFVIENSAGTDLLSYTTNGLFLGTLGGSLGIGTTNVYGAKAAVNTTANGNLGLVIRAAGAGQTANLQEWQNSAGTALGSISPAGAATFVSIDGGTP